ncbi:hypothetical protein BDV95DRAFT_226073 [Massariosphaeria phaeospora]|uniref:Uncharacterized protein n=1 Tax=Massariosphaeria phaeospora TaxID=100035 RepID=A0A7C8IHF9_9PLEO|nr:hypothetical protein BDV95DRAFT_226073 [Massariosphaeria phaeospora]
MTDLGVGFDRAVTTIIALAMMCMFPLARAKWCAYARRMPTIFETRVTSENQLLTIPLPPIAIDYAGFYLQTSTPARMQSEEMRLDTQ